MVTTAPRERSAPSLVTLQVPKGEGAEGSDVASSFDAELAAIDAVLAWSDAAIEKAKTPGPARAKDPLVYDSTGTKTSGLTNGGSC